MVPAVPVLSDLPKSGPDIKSDRQGGVRAVMRRRGIDKPALFGHLVAFVIVVALVAYSIAVSY